MIEVIKAESRGHVNHGWLNAKHTFSFAEYHNPERVRFGPLRVINEDRIAPQKGFDMHPHRDMEIVTYPISGAIEHKDSMGNEGVIKAGEVQRMTAGTGVLHSEFNHSPEEELHLLQIWIFPEQKNLDPGYEQTQVPREAKLNQLKLIASRDGREGSVTVHQEAEIYASVLEAGTSLTHKTSSDRKVFVQVVSGDVAVNGTDISAGDGVQIEDLDAINLSASSDAEFLLFDMG
ncbi:MAG: pirin family protein [Pseudomonadota bacterium]